MSINSTRTYNSMRARFVLLFCFGEALFCGTVVVEFNLWS